MTIKLDEIFSIERDVRSWNLIEIMPKTEKRKRDDLVYKDTTYHVTLEAALNAYADKCLSPCQSLVRVIEVMKETQAVIREVVGGMK